MKKRTFLIAAMLLGMTQGTWAQSTDETDDIDRKMSITTHLFLKEQNGEIKVERETQSTKRPGNKGVRHQNIHKAARLYASPDTIDGKAYIAAYLRLKDATGRSEVEAQGVILQEEFNNGLFTSLIPVEKLTEVAGISNVKRINVSPLKQIYTGTARQTTNVDDLLSISADAITAGLDTKYDGTGVVLGIIDTGIDFQHIAFKDKDGNYRMSHAYVYTGRKATDYSGSTLRNATTDDKSEDHGTHTSSTAGGSSVIVNNNNVTVTDDHSNATYGGMAPGADLYIAGIKNLNDTYLTNAVRKICDYADENNLPVVVSNSWGSQLGPHDGTGEVADVYNSLFGDDYPNHIALFAASNDGGKAIDGEVGGYHVSGMASPSNPLHTILRAFYYGDADAGYHYDKIVANIWCRDASVSNMNMKIHVLDSKTGAKLRTVNVTPTEDGVTVSGLSNYYSGTLYAFKDYIEANKTQIMLYTEEGLETTADTVITQNGSDYYKSKYTLAIEVYPESGSAIIDCWGGNYGYFTGHLTTNGYNWKAGSDDMTVSDEATIPSIISVGAYVSSRNWTDSSGSSWYIPSYTVGDIADFSSFATAEESTTGLQYPWITAPGARLAAAVNHNHTTRVDNYSYYGSSDLVVNNPNYPYAMMEGTSMATPTAAGIVALWLQAAKEVGKQLTVEDVKHVMEVTAINDSYTTTGPNATHFGKGKIDALAGIRYILNQVVLTDNGDSNGKTNVEVIDDYYTKSQSTGVPAANVVLSNRTLYKDTEWNTICLPFGIDDFTDTPLEGATVKALEGASFANHTLTLQFSESSLTSIEAGVPYIVKWANNGHSISNPEFKDVYLSTESPEAKAVTIDGIVTFRGSFDPMSFEANDTKTLFLGAGSTLYYPDENVTVNACRAWFELEGELIAGDLEENGVNAFVLDFNGNTTDIKTIPVKGQGAMDQWYMLDGRRLNGEPSTKGIYIHNGKKVAIQ